jgi:hypothetical protein
MATNLERTSRWVALVALAASAGFFAWYGVAVGKSWPAVMPFFGGFALAWVVSLLGIARRRWWGPSFTTGLSILTLSLMLPGIGRTEVVAFVLTQLALLGALGVRAMTEQEVGENAEGERTWRHGALAFTSGLAIPWLLAVGLLPGGGLAGVMGLVGAGVACLGIASALRGRTWGLIAIGGSIPLLLAVPPLAWGCITSPHDVAGEVASFTLASGLAVWVVPVLKRLRG